MSGWDEGNVFYSDQNLGQEPEDSSPLAARIKYREFIRNYRLDDTYLYREQLRSHYNLRKYYLEVNIDHLMTFDEDLANELMAKPTAHLPLFEQAAKEAAKLIAVAQEEKDEEPRDIQITLTSSKNPSTIRQLLSTQVSKLVQIPGIVIASTRSKPKATTVFAMCRQCSDTQKVKVKAGFGGAQLPRTCGRTRQPNEPPCPVDPYNILSEKCEYIDQQSLKLQECPEMVPTGEMPRNIQLSCDRNLVDMVTPGNRVTVIGVFSVVTQQDTQKRGDSNIAIRTPYLHVVGIKMGIEDTGSQSLTSFTPEEQELFREMAREKKIYERLSKSVAPSIFGHENIKKAVACQLFGGSRKILPDGMRLRGDVNVLLLGDPSCGKSQFLKFVEKAAPIGVYTSGKGSSAAGLTATVTQDSASREFYLEGGAMVLADGGVVCIDEFDKMREQDRVAIHEAMEQQTISVAKAGITTILNSRTSVLAAANPVFGRYDDERSASDNVDFQSTILSRFDMIFIVRDIRQEDRDRTLAQHVLSVHTNAAQPAAAVKDPDEIEVQLLRRYVQFCRLKCAPRLSPTAAEALQSFYVTTRSNLAERQQQWEQAQAGEDGSAGQFSAIPITVRQLEAIIRISESLAKMELAQVATERHVQEAIRLFQVSTLDAAATGDIHLEGSNLPGVQSAETQIQRRLSVGHQASVKKLIDDLVGSGMEERSSRMALEVMAQRGEVEFRNQKKVVKRVK